MEDERGHDEHNKGYDQADYFSALSSEFALPVDMVEKMAAELETADHFDGLLAHLQETHDNVYGKMYEDAEYSLEDGYDEGMEP